jgi:hypothetical protein
MIIDTTKPKPGKLRQNEIDVENNVLLGKLIKIMKRKNQSVRDTRDQVARNNVYNTNPL